jgi:hypothetical protein
MPHRFPFLRRNFPGTFLSIVVVLSIAIPALPRATVAQADEDDLPGIVDEGTWEGPQFGTTVTWNEDWSPQPESTFSDKESEIEQVSLIGERGYFNATVLKVRDETLVSYRDSVQRTRAEVNVETDYHLIESSENDLSAYLAYTATSEGKELTVAIEIFFVSDDLIGMSEIVAWTSNLPALFDDVQSEVVFNDETPFGYYYTSATLPTAVVGFTGTRTYESPQFGAEVTWEVPWESILAETFSDSDDEIDTLTIGTTRSDLVTIFASIPGQTPAESLELRHDELESSGLFENIEVIDEGSDDEGAYLALTVDQDDATAMVLLEAIWLDEGDSVVQIVELMTWLENMESELESARKSVSIDGVEPFRYFPTAPVREALGFADPNESPATGTRVGLNVLRPASALSRQEGWGG